MQPTLFGERFGISESQQRLSEYVAKLFAEGELMDVIEIAQKELETGKFRSGHLPGLCNFNFTSIRHCPEEPCTGGTGHTAFGCN